MFMYVFTQSDHNFSLNFVVDIIIIMNDIHVLFSDC